MPDNEISEFSEVIEWLNEGDATSRYNMDDYSSHVIEHFIEGAKPLPINAVVGRRKYGREAPYAFFALEFDNSAFQILIPCPKQDKRLAGRILDIPFLPSRAEYGVKN